MIWFVDNQIKGVGPEGEPWRSRRFSIDETRTGIITADMTGEGALTLFCVNPLLIDLLDLEDVDAALAPDIDSIVNHMHLAAGYIAKVLELGSD